MSIKYLDPYFDDSFSYTGVCPLAEVAEQIKLPASQILKLNANENLYGFATNLLAEKLKETPIAHYPDPAQKKIRKQIASYVGLAENQILAGNGSDEVIDLLCRFLPQDSSAMIFPPSFGYYEYLIRLNRHQVIACGRNKDFTIDLEKAKKWQNNPPAIIFLCSPNNPTGNLVSKQELQFFLSWDCLVVVDEAYFEFSQKSYIYLLAKHKNLVILRTFSKYFGLAGLRLGYGLMSADLQEKLLALKYPYNINQIAGAALEVCFAHQDIFEKQRIEIKNTRQQFLQILQKYPKVETYPSQANFVLCKIKDYSIKLLSEQLFKKGVLVRYFQTGLLENFIRISIGTPQQMEKFILILQGILK